MNGGIQTYMTLIGMVSISDDGSGSIDGVYLPNSNLPFREQRECPALVEAARQIDEYLTGKRMTFKLPLKTEGTEFQKKVWNEIKNIPYGETASYSDIAKRIGNPNAYRAVGSACNANPIPLIIPCHRVVASKDIGGYGGGLTLKKKLMEIEGIRF
ncbi:methylated-DNA--protein-cysteine methyltransferase [Candidatus Methanoplasma termitum]|uniref:Methylated-DNA--protein-cysteine methyltransferase n=1 Tax=Candidatus Methanoplasma termitum TaxID=1577791 RepID=A0A0A7LBB4_9ARCH|nr:methylated-DNA--[protein]-cysteine S-methyltransferase [Candidatus Methanoplasma termitum]AIZ56303.1 methylated-DNA--protein-cysteine methyltransferase [Candidatus Methanoplasma termitum]MCL2333852.1 methylated-DNA--[protein]-cysteine S-methyltransferase [Candidatus Methanoplasma sp.]